MYVVVIVGETLIVALLKFPGIHVYVMVPVPPVAFAERLTEPPIQIAVSSLAITVGLFSSFNVIFGISNGHSSLSHLTQRS